MFNKELYDMESDPHQMNNLAGQVEHADALNQHRKVLEDWIQQTDDKGQYPESSSQLRATFKLWKDKPIFADADVNPEYDQFR